MAKSRSEHDRDEPEPVRADAIGQAEPHPSVSASWTPANVLALQRAGASNHAIAAVMLTGGGPSQRRLGRSKNLVNNPYGTLKQDPPPRPAKGQTATEKPKPEVKPVKGAAKPMTEMERRQQEIYDNKQADNALLVAEREELMHEVRHVRSQLEASLASGKHPQLKGDLDQALYSLRVCEGQYARQPTEAKDAVRIIKERLTKGSTAIEKFNAASAPPGETREQYDAKRFTTLAQLVRDKFKAEDWPGNATGGVFGFTVDPDDPVLHAKFMTEFGRETKDIESDIKVMKSWPGKAAAGSNDRWKVYYYVTKLSNSGYAYDISAHAFLDGKPKGTVIVLHVPKAPPKPAARAK